MKKKPISSDNDNLKKFIKDYKQSLLENFQSFLNRKRVPEKEPHLT